MNRFGKLAFDILLDDFTNSSNRTEWVKARIGKANDNNYYFYKTIVNEAITIMEKKYHIQLNKNKGYNRIQNLVVWSVEDDVERIRLNLSEAVCISLKIPNLNKLYEQVGTPTDEEHLQCAYCCVNKKDRVIPCGHLICCVCLDKLPKDECPNCKKAFHKSFVIKVYL